MPFRQIRQHPRHQQPPSKVVVNFETKLERYEPEHSNYFKINQFMVEKKASILIVCKRRLGIIMGRGASEITNLKMAIKYKNCDFYKQITLYSMDYKKGSLGPLQLI